MTGQPMMEMTAYPWMSSVRLVVLMLAPGDDDKNPLFTIQVNTARAKEMQNYALKTADDKRNLTG